VFFPHIYDEGSTAKAAFPDRGLEGMDTEGSA
jgi:hypothetical protein